MSSYKKWMPSCQSCHSLFANFAGVVCQKMAIFFSNMTCFATTAVRAAEKHSNLLAKHSPVIGHFSLTCEYEPSHGLWLGWSFNKPDKPIICECFFRSFGFCATCIGIDMGGHLIFVTVNCNLPLKTSNLCLPAIALWKSHMGGWGMREPSLPLPLDEGQECQPFSSL